MVEIKGDDWTLFDKIMYGGLGYGSFCLPTNFFMLIVAIMFPPLGEVLVILDDKISPNFPFITWECVLELIKFESINRLVYSVLLTTLFYIPGLVYVLGNINNLQYVKVKNNDITVENE
jgi:hypothetical protein